MTRRSPEVVDGALGFHERSDPRDASYVWEALDILADEVRALRVELEQAQGSTLYHICLQLKKQVAALKGKP